MENNIKEQVTKIKVIGVGGGGCNAISKMMNKENGIANVQFFAANTDLQVLSSFPVESRLPLGYKLCKGLGCGGYPEKGKEAAIESQDTIKKILVDTDMLFICAGMGGGTGTGAAPEIARIARELGILTVGVVTRPFMWEGGRRIRNANEGLDSFKKYVDSLIVIPNDRLQSNFGNIQMTQAFTEADNVLRQTIQAITDLITYRSDINLDFEDVRTVMANMGEALIGIGTSVGQGPEKAVEAAKNAVECPLLESNITGAKHAIINVTTSTSTVNDIRAVMDYITSAAGTDLDIIWGFINNPNLEDNAIIVTVIATGFEERKPIVNQDTNQEQMVVTENINQDNDYTPSFFRNRG